MWSAFRDPSFGFAGLTFQSDTQATINWYRNIDQTPGSKTLVAVDSTSYTKRAAPQTLSAPKRRLRVLLNRSTPDPFNPR